MSSGMRPHRVHISDRISQFGRSKPRFWWNVCADDNIPGSRLLTERAQEPGPRSITPIDGLTPNLTWGALARSRPTPVET